MNAITVKISVKGKSFGTVYNYIDDNTRCYFSDIHTIESERRKGYANELLKEMFIAATSFNEIFLWVKEDSWMKKWYERNGFEAIKNAYYDKEKTLIWMVKINKSNLK